MIYPFDKEYPVTLKFWAKYPPEIAEAVGYRHHRGIDFDTPSGVRIKAVASGTIVFAGEDRGLGVVIQDKDEVWRYWHLSKIWRDKYSGYVKAGEYVGLSGDTGLSIGAHTHIELQRGGQFVDWLKEMSELKKLQKRLKSVEKERDDLKRDITKTPGGWIDRVKKLEKERDDLRNDILAEPKKGNPPKRGWAWRVKQLEKQKNFVKAGQLYIKK